MHYFIYLAHPRQIHVCQMVLESLCLENKRQRHTQLNIFRWQIHTDIAWLADSISLIVDGFKPQSDLYI